MAKAFDTVWIDGLLYKLALLNCPSYLDHTISLYLQSRKFEVSFQTATSSRRGMRARVAKGGLMSSLVYVNDILSTSHHIELAYADNTAIRAIPAGQSCSSATWSHISTTFSGGLSECRININVSKSTGMMFVRARRRFIQRRPVTLFG